MAVVEEVKDLYQGKDLSIDHYLIRCARSTELFSHVNKDFIDIRVYDKEKLLDVSCATFYKSKIKQIKFELKQVDEESKKDKKRIYKEKIAEIKLSMKVNGRNPEDKTKLKEIMKLGFLGYHKKRRSNLVETLIPLGDLVIESDEFSKKRNKEVEEFFNLLPNTVIEHPYVDDWKEVSSPKGYDAYFNISEKQYKSREKYLKSVIAKITGLSLNKRADFEKVMLECASIRAEEELAKNTAFSNRLDNTRNAIWAWSASKKYPEITTKATSGLNALLAEKKSKEMLEYSRLKNHYMMHNVYHVVVRELKKELAEITEKQM